MYLLLKWPLKQERRHEERMSAPSCLSVHMNRRKARQLTLPIPQIVPLASTEVLELVNRVINGREHLGFERLLRQPAGGVPASKDGVGPTCENTVSGQLTLFEYRFVKPGASKPETHHPPGP